MVATAPGFAKTQLIDHLVENGMEAAGIEQILRLLGEYDDDELPATVRDYAGGLIPGFTHEVALVAEPVPQ